MINCDMTQDLASGVVNLWQVYLEWRYDPADTLEKATAAMRELFPGHTPEVDPGSGDLAGVWLVALPDEVIATVQQHRFASYQSDCAYLEVELP